MLVRIFYGGRLRAGQSAMWPRQRPAAGEGSDLAPEAPTGFLSGPQPPTELSGLALGIRADLYSDKHALMCPLIDEYRFLLPSRSPLPQGT